MKPFAEQIALVTGAGTGIGRSIALALSARGAKVLLLGRRTGPLEAVAAQAGTARTRVCPVDLTDDAAIRAFATAIESEPGRLDILVHSAAALRIGATADASADDLDVQHRTNVHGPYALTQALLPLLKRSRGQVVFINSSAGLTARRGVGQYAATKHALRAIADSLRDEVNRDGVRVLSVYPGRTATPLQEELHRMEGKPYRPERLLQPSDVAEMVVCALSLPRTAEVTEIMIRPMCGPDAAEGSS